MILCDRCGLAYANAVPAVSAILRAYEVAEFDSSREAAMAAATYGRILAKDLATLDRDAFAIDIGTGTGDFLSELKDSGFRNPLGFEPSVRAIEAAHDDIRPLIRNEIFDATSVPNGSASFVSCFMTLEHVDDPLDVVRASHAALGAGGVFAAVVHDRTALLNRILGRRSPIIDIEHLQLFSPADATDLFRRAGFESISFRHFANTYRLGYWLRLTPLPKGLKKVMLEMAERTGLADVNLSLPVGNMLVTGRKLD
jgi:SAM-dependent methyltransferase